MTDNDGRITCERCGELWAAGTLMLRDRCPTCLNAYVNGLEEACRAAIARFERISEMADSALLAEAKEVTP